MFSPAKNLAEDLHWLEIVIMTFDINRNANLVPNHRLLHLLFLPHSIDNRTLSEMRDR